MTEIERLAKVLWSARASFADSKTCPAWEELGADAQEVYLMLVRAVLMALREPSDEMVDAAWRPYRHGNTKEFDEIMKGENGTIRSYLRSMIDYILEGK